MTGRKTSAVVLTVFVEHPADWNGYDVHDVLRFHLDLSDLSDVEVDLSEVRVLDSKLIDRTDA